MHPSVLFIDDDDAHAKALAWYHVTYHPAYYNDEMNQTHFISFPWCVHEKLINIKQKKLEKRG